MIPGTFLAAPDSLGAIVVIYGPASGLDPTRVAEFDFTSATVNGASGAGAINVIYGSYVSYGNGFVSTGRQVLTQATFGSTPQAGANFGKAMY